MCRCLQNVELISNMKVIFLLLACLSISRAGDLLRGTTSFATKLYDVLPNKEQNLIFSPLSVHSVLSLAYQGAVGETAESLRRSLNVPDAANTANEYKDIVKVLNAKGDVTVEVANKIYVKDGYRLKNDFKKVATENFAAEADSIDFSKSEEAANNINGWVKNKTHYKIDKLVSQDDFSSATRLVLLNAIYFKGQWDKQFKKSDTKKEKFYISETVTVDCDMMTRAGYFYYDENTELDAKLIKLPYKDRRFSMIIVLPNNITGVNELEKKLSRTDVNSLFKNFATSEVILYLPKFKIKSTIKLNDPLKAVGLSKIFQDNADFSNLIDPYEPLKVDKVIQKAFIEVNEVGSVAGAATAGFGVAVIAIPPVVYKADHPFIFYLTVKVETEDMFDFPFEVEGTDTILFSGRVNDASVETEL